MQHYQQIITRCGVALVNMDVLLNLLSLALLLLAVFIVLMNYVFLLSRVRTKSRPARHPSLLPLAAPILAILSASFSSRSSEGWLPSFIPWMIALVDPANIGFVLAAFRKKSQT